MPSNKVKRIYEEAFDNDTSLWDYYLDEVEEELGTPRNDLEEIRFILHLLLKSAKEIPQGATIKMPGISFSLVGKDNKNIPGRLITMAEKTWDYLREKKLANRLTPCTLHTGGQGTELTYHLGPVCGICNQRMAEIRKEDKPTGWFCPECCPLQVKNLQSK